MSDELIEAGQQPGDLVFHDEADALDGLLSRLRAEGGRPVAGSRLSDWAAAAAQATEAPGPARLRPGKVGVPSAPWKRRIATALASLLVLVGGMSGLAWAANGSAPGGALYGLDRALEHVGIGNGGAAERLAEVRGLIESGDIPGGLSHAGEVVVTEAEESDDEGAGAAVALEEAAARVVGVGSEASAEVREQVGALLTYLSEHVGQVDGQQVAELARQIAGNPEPRPPEGVPPVEPGPPEGVPPAEPGPPDGVPPDQPGGPPVSIPPVIVGPPVEPGPPISLPDQVP